MDRLIYTSLTALRGAMARQASTANNLANASTVGFRAELARQAPLWVTGGGAPDETRAPASEEVLGADMKAGSVNQTGNPLDVAMQGDAMLAVQAPNGDEAYTRRGDLQIAPSGLLTTGDGIPVLGDSGPITLPPVDKVSVDSNGQIWIVPQGGDPSQPQAAAQLKVVTPAGSDTVKGIDGLFRVRGGGSLPSDPDARVISGALEQSNVNMSKELVSMIEASRSWEMQTKLISTAKDLDTQTASLMQLPDQ
jgi:flagellar basal-body rod protein FlgF